VITCFVGQHAQEGKEIGEALGQRYCIVPALEMASCVNSALPTLSDFIAVIDGATLSDGWAPRCIEAVNEGLAVVSPFVVLGGVARPWHAAISPYAWVMEVDKLRHVGGLSEIGFGYERLLAARLPEWCDSTPFAEATPVDDPGRSAKLGELYYRQLEDSKTVDNLLKVP
jgi:hypothetical protein